MQILAIFGLGGPEIILVSVFFISFIGPAFMGYRLGSKTKLGGLYGFLLGLFLSFFGIVLIIILDYLDKNNIVKK